MHVRKHSSNSHNSEASDYESSIFKIPTLSTAVHCNVANVSVIVAVQRKVLQPVTLPSGAYLPAGNLIAVPQQAVYQDASEFPEPLLFNPHRFRPRNQESDEATKKFTDVSYTYLHWGSPRRAWYV